MRTSHLVFRALFSLSFFTFYYTKVNAARESASLKSDNITIKVTTILIDASNQYFF